MPNPSGNRLLSYYLAVMRSLEDFDPLSIVGELRGAPWDARDVARFWQGADLSAGRRRMMYVHVPFCDDLCTFCVYHKRRLDDATRPSVSPYCRHVGELAAYLAPNFAGAEFQAISVGGGTPSVLSPEQIGSIFAPIFSKYAFSRGAYRGVEFRPRDATRERLAAFREFGFSTIHFGVQSLDQSVLDRINRSDDDRETVRSAVALAREAGFDDIRTHLIAGLGGDDPRRLAESAEYLCALGVDEITSYSLLLTASYAKSEFGFADQVSAQKNPFFDAYADLLADVARRTGYELTSGRTVEGSRIWDLTLPTSSADGKRSYSDIEVDDLVAFGPSARSKRAGVGHYVGRIDGFSGAFDPAAKSHVGVWHDAETVAVQRILASLRDGARFMVPDGSPAQVRSRLGLLRGAGLARNDGDAWEVVSPDKRRIFLAALVVAGPALVARGIDGSRGAALRARDGGTR